MKKKILIFTASRSEYGILRSIIFNLSKNKNIKLDIMASGSHLSSYFGNTISEIKKDGFKNIKKIKTLNKMTGDDSICETISIGIKKISQYLEKKKPNLILIVGDRHELFSICISGLFHNIPIAHIHGGENTNYVVDDYIRHSVTKMSTFHFASNKTYRKRIIQMGEIPKNVILSGSPSVDLIKKINFLNKKELELSLNVNLNKKIFIVTYQPVTLSKKKSIYEINNLLKSLSNFTNYNIIFTLPNHDKFSNLITNKIKSYCNKRSNFFYFNSLGHLNYLSLLKISELVIGNSSSGIIEAPYLNIPTVNIGKRQQGRLMGRSVLSCNSSKISIISAIKKALILKKNRRIFSKKLYGDGNASKKISNFLVKVKLKKFKFGKKFNDLKFKL
tara:strand:+ start:17050 stop:18216 length:1167 start_codon:yes stop_codon:yes gene_type:complete